MNPKTLSFLIEQADERAEQAQRRVAQLQRMADQAQGHLRLLQQYAGEYDARAATRVGFQRDISAHENQAHFIGKLEDAVAMQDAEAALRTRAVESARNELALCLKRQKSLQTLRQRIAEAARQSEARLDQKRNDEFAARPRNDASGSSASMHTIGRHTGDVP